MPRVGRGAARRRPRRVLEGPAADYRTPIAAAVAGTLVAAGAATSAVGLRRGDPGLTARMMATLLKGDRR